MHHFPPLPETRKMQNISVLLSLFLTNVLSLHLTSAYNYTLIYSFTNDITTTDIQDQSLIRFLFHDLTSLLTYSNANFSGFAESTCDNMNCPGGIVLCRGDYLDPLLCGDCLNQSYQYITNQSAYPLEAVIWYDFCILQYTIKSFDNITKFLMGNTRKLTGPIFTGWDQSNNSISMRAFINSTLHLLLRNVSQHAAFHSDTLFATGMANNNTVTNNTVSLPVIYAISQCVPDLTPNGCNDCLQNLTELLLDSFDGSQAGRIVGVDCNLRYETDRFFSEDPDVNLSYIYAASTETPSFPPDSNKGRINRHLGIIIGATVALLIFGCFIGIFLFRKLRSAETEISKEEKTLTTSDDTLDLWNGEGSSDVPFFHFNQMIDATSNFSLDNKLGQGGFGPVYKGVLQDGLEIAIKRLSACSGQGLTEFRNEIQLIGKLQHRNLVRLVGWCVHGQEKLLVYEFMPNKSLDFFIFDETRAARLDWERRFEIIEGIAQGLVYLHKHSRLRIVHRDLKASNILLDSDLNPKISDFGLARIFGPKELEANTNRVVGTYGYMAPEYACEGLFSIKSDVFSYGVLLLEIVSGKRNMGFHQYGDFLNLLGYAWDRWKEARFFELICPTLTEVSQRQVERCIHIALLCVQENLADRPTMSDVITFLTTASIVLPEPKQPAYFNVRVSDKAEESSDLDGSSCSINYVTSTNPEVR